MQSSQGPTPYIRIQWGWKVEFKKNWRGTVINNHKILLLVCLTIAVIWSLQGICLHYCKNHPVIFHSNYIEYNMYIYINLLYDIMFTLIFLNDEIRDIDVCLHNCFILIISAVYKHLIHILPCFLLSKYCRNKKPIRLTLSKMNKGINLVYILKIA